MSDADEINFFKHFLLAICHSINFFSFFARLMIELEKKEIFIFFYSKSPQSAFWRFDAARGIETFLLSFVFIKNLYHKKFSML